MAFDDPYSEKPQELTKDEYYTLSKKVDEILKQNQTEPLLSCKRCQGELALRMEVNPGPPPSVTRIAYNCNYCFAMNVVWQSAELIK